MCVCVCVYVCEREREREREREGSKQAIKQAVRQTPSTGLITSLLFRGSLRKARQGARQTMRVLTKVLMELSNAHDAGGPRHRYCRQFDSRATATRRRNWVTRSTHFQESGIPASLIHNGKCGSSEIVRAESLTVCREANQPKPVLLSELDRLWAGFGGMP